MQVTVAVSDIEEGCHVRSLELKDPKDASRIMATLKVCDDPPNLQSTFGMTVYNCIIYCLAFIDVPGLR